MLNYLTFFMNSVLLGVGLAMDAFSVSIANGLIEPHMKRSRMAIIAGTYAGFQFAMPMIGWFLVHTIATHFQAFQKIIPWVALILLSYIGGKMIYEGIQEIRGQKEDAPVKAEASSGRISAHTLILQGIATSIDALSVGFTIASYGALSAFTCSLIIALVTFFICMGGLIFGRIMGKRFAQKATIAGGLILIGIGLEIFFH